MKSSFNPVKKSIRGTSKKTAVFLLVFVMLFSFLLTPLKTVKAQLPVTDVTLVAQNLANSAYNKAKTALSKLLLKAGATSFQQVVRTALNKIAYDTATYLGSGNSGQKPLFITEGWGSYLSNVGDAAAGQFIESFVNNLSVGVSANCQKAYQVCAETCNNRFSTSSTDAEIIGQSTECLQTCKEAAYKCGATGAGGAAGSDTGYAGAAINLNSLNICQPSSLEAKVKIGLGLVQYQTPVANCTASQMISNWGDEVAKISDWKDANFLDNIKGMFDPTTSDLGIYMSARSNIISAEAGASTLAVNDLLANKGWLSKRNAAGESAGTPGDAERKAETTEAAAKDSLLRTTGDIVVDAANVFVNQIAISKFNDLMSNLGKKTSDLSSSGRNSSDSITKREGDSSASYSAARLKESLYSIIKPDFSIKADYDILSKLMVCLDKNNPGPTDCVIDSKFSQAISENKTVIEAVKEGYINSDWQLTEKTAEGSYSLRNVSILRKYRILPIGWEEAIKRAYANSKDVKRITVMDMISCFDGSDEYQQFSSNFNTNEQEWCRGLVDPNWVLKAPLNYCSKQGSGAQIISKIIVPSYGSKGDDDYVASIFNINRDEEYCADEKTCIKEKVDGSCEAYGYCNEERRTWNFSADGCDPIYNTCQSFTNSSTGKNFSYLKNTLNYSGCNATSVGCRQYSSSGAYNVSTGAVSWNKEKTVYFNNSLSACNQDGEGCTELIRVKPTWGVNLIMNANFEDDEIGSAPRDWNVSFNNSKSNSVSVVDIASESIEGTGRALKISGGNIGTVPFIIGAYSNAQKSLLPDNFQLVYNQDYTLSADVYITSGVARIYMGDLSDGFVKSTSNIGSWQHLSITRTAANGYNEPVFSIENQTSGNNKVIYIRNVKFEVSNYETGFNVYGSTYKVYEKLIPPYLESVCYNNISSATKDYTLKSNVPAVCYDFARRCNREEVGCEKFIGVKDNIAVSAQVTASDYCWGNCLGYDVYVSKGNNFNSPEAENIIPSTAVSCRADSAGCNEFTNLDALNAGGENKEYYSAMKRCIKPGQGTCGTFYGWEGTNNGYQLRSYNLAQSNNQPKLTSETNSLNCNQEIYNKKADEIGYNPDCREFYNSAGQIFYALISETITCSDDCHTYRLSGKNIDKTITSTAACSSSENPAGYYWDSNAKVCYSCLNGGTWDSATGSCLYQAIPGEGKTCMAAENGCREYNGNSGNNVQTLVSYDFESGSQGWAGKDSLSTVAIANEKDGHSMYYNSNKNSFVRIGVNNMVKEGKSYSLRFLAKADTATDLDIFFTDNLNNPSSAKFSAGKITVKSGGEWNIYQANLDNLDHAISENETLTIVADNDFYFDDFVLTEITDRYYLIKNSSVVPDICSYDINSVYRGEEYNLGCAQYKDRDNLTHNLRKFSKLCSNSAVGCEQVIATQNYSPYYSGIWGDTNNNKICDTNEKDCVQVDRDETIYAVFDSSKQCNSADMGCSRLGQSSASGSDWSDVFKKNNPNLYSSILCGQAEVGCEKWTTEDGSESYFRDPGNETCQYRTSHDPAVPGKAWYKIPVKRCDFENSNGSIDTAEEKAGMVCSSDSMCASSSCIVDNNDYPCETSYFETFGLGGAGNQVPVPSKQAGLCQATASGCTEYIDPISNFSVGLLYNSSHKLNDNGEADGWKDGTQEVSLSPNKLYILSVDKGDKDTVLEFDAIVKPLLADNNLGASITTITAQAGTSTRIMFASLANSSVFISGGETDKKIELKEAIINYQFKDNVDTVSCNGTVNLDAGCILFNERSTSGASGLTSGKFDALNSINGQAPKNCSSDNKTCTANKLIKVSPDRVCSKWLSCIAYSYDSDTGEKVCSALGECTRLDDKNECANFEDVPSGNISFDDLGKNKNATGYYLLDNYHLSNMKEVGLKVSGANYDFEGGAARENTLIISEPENSPTDYPAHNTSYLKVPAGVTALVGEKISVQKNQTYFINFLVNTRGSGLAARMIIEFISTDGIISTTTKDFYSSNGWTRQIMPFKTSGSADKIRIYLGADNTGLDTQAVYFDDINIEPVLEIGGASGNQQYVSRECRLYPNNESLTCVNKNENVLTDGWEGYCLEHDPDNPSVCLLWYPVDKINASELSKANGGYQGTFPLNYCTEVNGNFELLKKVEGHVMEDGTKGSNYENNVCLVFEGCMGNNDPNYITISAEGGQSNTTHSYQKRMCVPKINDDLLFQKKVTLSSVDPKGCTPSGIAAHHVYLCSDINSTQSNCSGGNGATIDGIQVRDYLAQYFDYENDKLSYNEGWVNYGGGFKTYTWRGVSFNEIDSATPPVRVYDYNNPPASADDLKFISSDGTNGDNSKIYRLTCNNFVQVVDASGENTAWTGRVGSNAVWSTSTPPFFVEDVSNLFYNATSSSDNRTLFHGLQTYYRNLSKTPYGAASWPDNFNIADSNEAIPLKNQYSDTNKEKVLAGLPYGCSNYKENEFNKANGCSYIGYCSNNHNIYCLTDATLTSGTNYVSENTCGGYGTCQPLWTEYLGEPHISLTGRIESKPVDFKAILNKLFLKSYNSYSWESNKYKAGSINWDNSSNSDLEPCPSGGRPVASYSSITNSRESFCYINPSIGEISITHDEKGIYGIEFTTKIDPEQQPLKEIYIDWGDGFTQTITGQNSHPSVDDPHVFYHYYRKTPTGKIKIEIKDNWGKTGSTTKTI